MGTQYQALCNECGHSFTVREGPGMLFELVHCERCGRSRGVSRRDLADYYWEHHDGTTENRSEESRRPSLEERRSTDWLMVNRLAGMTPQEYCEAIEAVTGRCACGGGHRLDASPRCPACGASDYRPDPNSHETIMYD
jgi:hypothetical protein